MNSFEKLLCCCFLIKQSLNKITLLEGDQIFTKDIENAEISNIFIFNSANNLNTPGFEEVNSFAEKISHLILKAIFKYMTPKYASIIAISHVING